MNTRSKKIKTAVIAIISVFTLSIIFSLPSALLAQEEEGATEEETFETPEEITFDVSYPEIKAKSGQPFEFSLDLTYVGPDPLTFDLKWEAPEGWYVQIMPSYQETEISAVKLEPDKAETLNVTAMPLVKKQPGEYPIKVIASHEESGLEETAEVNAIVTATYELDFTTKTGRLNTEVTSGKDNKYTLVLNNNGSDSIENLSLSVQEPEGWMVGFENDEIETLEAGEEKEVVVTIKPPEKTIAGDYMLSFSASSDNANDSLELRVTVLTPTIWGWVGIGIIVVVIVGVAVIFARLGRR
ncbi:MAG: NEW3 domain-containing protein [Candidatus Humimicrobiaceae bacterium]